ncbi:MAG: 2-haloacid dehalogenase [Rhodospirillaceae bacterium]|jgi:2-haloacid dehalogenase|nr:2-haloacid dehalogenase [Rhodospirillaceae bacterium]
MRHISRIFLSDGSTKCKLDGDLDPVRAEIAAVKIMPTVKACVFDAYGTLFDVHSAVKRHEGEIGPAADDLSRLWRTKQLEYTWVRSLMRRHEDFRECTANALDFAMASYGLQSRADIRTALLDAYMTLDAYPEVPEVLRRLRAAGLLTAILSNGSPGMLEAAIRSAGLADLLDLSLSVEEVGIYKPDAAVYRLVTDRLKVAPDCVSFQSSNAWDVAGARQFGFRVIWINRTGQPSEYDLRGEVPEVRSLAEIPEVVLG